MGWFRKKSDPITDRARALNEQIARLEAQIEELSQGGAATLNYNFDSTPPETKSPPQSIRPSTPDTSSSGHSTHLSKTGPLPAPSRAVRTHSPHNPASPGPSPARENSPAAKTTTPSPFSQRPAGKPKPAPDSTPPPPSATPPEPPAAPSSTSNANSEESLAESTQPNPFRKPTTKPQPKTTDPSRELGVRKNNLTTYWRRLKNNFRGPATSNPKLVNYLAAGSIQGLRPLRYEKRVARNRFLLLLLCLVFVLWGIIALFTERY